MHNQTPVRLGPAEDVLIAQLEHSGNREAAAQLRLTGLPTRRVEAFHYTDLKMALKQVPELAGIADKIGAPKLRTPGAFRVLMSNGHVEVTGTAPAGVILSELEGSSLTERDNPLVRINRALVNKSLRVELQSSVDPIVHIDRRVNGSDEAAAVHASGAVLIEVAAGASATVLETFAGSDEAHMGTHGTRVMLGEGATLTHVVVDLSGPQARHFHSVECVQSKKSNLRTLYIHRGSALSRTQLYAELNGEQAHADFSGLNLVNGGQHCDFTIDVIHTAPNTTSSEVYKSIVHSGARAVFQGKITVAQLAQKTDAKMMAQGLMLAEDAEILTKPELEIFADDVQCGHGATCGELDEDALFYLMSRGISNEQSSAMLIRAFVQELLDPIEDEELSEALTGVVDEWLDGDSAAS